jgi:hypothetical protein
MANTKGKALESLLERGREGLRMLLPREAKARKFLGISIGCLLLFMVFTGIWRHKQPLKLEGPLIGSFTYFSSQGDSN